ncbi:helix-turn-helix domain-containing protein [Maricaulis sp.]|uniref:AraC family transcriptional regulator n=1 Tax=Maricaulis sp. TaxID=1486257 RepID=UPI00260982E4|nr:helix-turn-helix domain-containing protein [Maricaulis sp.]
MNEILGLDRVTIVPVTGAYNCERKGFQVLDERGAPRLACARVKQSACLISAYSRDPALLLSIPVRGRPVKAISHVTPCGGAVGAVEDECIAHVPDGADYLVFALMGQSVGQVLSSVNVTREPYEQLIRVYNWARKDHLTDAVYALWDSMEGSEGGSWDHGKISDLNELSHRLVRIEDAVKQDIQKFIRGESTCSAEPDQLVLSRAATVFSTVRHRSLSKEELVSLVGTSAKRIEFAVGRHLGMSPKQWHLMQRLGYVRSALKRANPYSTKVADIAPYFGFRHHGRFSQIYRRVFNEYPSTALK